MNAKNRKRGSLFQTLVLVVSSVVAIGIPLLAPSNHSGLAGLARIVNPPTRTTTANCFALDAAILVRHGKAVAGEEAMKGYIAHTLRGYTLKAYPLKRTPCAKISA